jgi:GNAT superfamily N-acetyltransferase
VKNQQNLVLLYDKRCSKSAQRWIQKQLSKLATDSPRFTQIGLSEDDDAIFSKTLKKAGFRTRYEILMGDTRIAFKNLMKKKRPLSNLNHLGLELLPITSRPQVMKALSLQKRIALQSQNHGYFSHTAEQLRKDKKEYLRMVAKKDGLLLGVYRGKTILGFMLTGIHEDPSRSGKIGGFSFFLHPSIQGLGITKTGYRVMLEYLLKAKVYKFVGGTSQPAIQAMGKIMKRQVQHVVYVKMGPSR